jgi:drug/metabolite transporter (DMT)-like permease
MKMTAKPMPVAMLFLLCLLAALAVVHAELLPATRPSNPMPLLERQALLAALAALASFAFARLAPRPPAILHAFAPALSPAIPLAFGLIVFPALADHFVAHTISAYTHLTLSAMAPLFTIVFLPYLPSLQPSATHHATSSPTLLAALAALAGAFLLFPTQLPSSWTQAIAWLLLLLATAGLGAANCLAPHIVLPHQWASTAAVTAASAAILLAASSALLEHPVPPSLSELPSLATLDLPAMLLLFWLFTHLGPSQLATRALFPPLLTVLLGFIAFLPDLDPQFLFGLFLLAGAALNLLLARPRPQHPSGLSLTDSSPHKP